MAAHGERLTSTPFLQQWVQRDSRSPHSGDEVREDEPWTVQTETLLHTWSLAWDRKAEAHGCAEGRARKGHLLLQIPTVLVPIILAPILAGKLVDETNFGVIIALIASGLTGGLQTILGLERKSEQHAQAAFRYNDLLSDAEEVLAKEAHFRPHCDVTIQKFKMRMDSAERYSPPVSLPAAADSESENP